MSFCAVRQVAQMSELLGYFSMNYSIVERYDVIMFCTRSMNKEIQLIKERVLLRPYCLDDVEFLYEAARESVVEVQNWLPWCHANYSRQESETWIKSCDEAWAKGTAYEFAIFDTKTGLYLGGCGLNHIDPIDKIANLGYWVRSSQTSEGVATTATILLVHFGFRGLKLNRIEIVAATGNKASQRVAEKAGAKREGILRNRCTVNDQVLDAMMFSFIPQDFPEINLSDCGAEGIQIFDLLYPKEFTPQRQSRFHSLP